MSKPDKRIGNVEIRYDHEGLVDEVVVYQKGKDGAYHCILHLEMLGENHAMIMMCSTDQKEGAAIDIGVQKGKLKLTEQEGWW